MVRQTNIVLSIDRANNKLYNIELYTIRGFRSVRVLVDSGCFELEKILSYNKVDRIYFYTQ